MERAKHYSPWNCRRVGAAMGHSVRNSGITENERNMQAALNPWRNLPAHYAGRWAYDYDEKNSTFFVHCGGHRILDAEDSEVCEAVCQAHNGYLPTNAESDRGP